MKQKAVQSPKVGGSPAGVEQENPAAASLRAKPYPAPKTSGIKIRGTGAATKGTMARGPMG